MNQIGNVISVLTLISLAAIAAAQPTIVSDNKEVADATCTAAQTKQLAREAHTSAEYKALALCFGKQQSSYMAQAAEEKDEWLRRSQNIVSTAAKYPRPVDSARYLYEYYSYKVAEASALSQKYSHLAEEVPSTSTQ